MREPRAHNCTPHYERPEQPWVCGLASNGAACPAGPTASGRCPALAECKPVRDGDRWRCNRSPLRGGPCDEGPTPEGGCPRVHVCRPVRSLRAIRKRFVFAMAVLATGGMFVLLSAYWRNNVIAPGPLAQSHAQLFDSAGGDAKCSACHAAADDGALAWAGRIVALDDTGATQSQLCLKCHGGFIPPELALVAHNVPPDLLREHTDTRTNGSGGGLARAVEAAFSPGNQLACSTCHAEHHGPHADLTAIDNRACQACHRQRYESFAADHPDFGIWPYERRTRIAFNHASHQSKHFVEKSLLFDCRKCHMLDTTRSVELAASYETACAECHDEKIRTSVARGVPMFALPSLDVEALRAAGHDVGSWPEQASGDFDGRLPPAMKLLLAADARTAGSIANLGNDLDFFDVDVDDPPQLKACAELAMAAKSLLADMSERGPVAVGERLSNVLGQEVNNQLLSALVSGMAANTVRDATADWLQMEIEKGQSANWPAPNTIRATNFVKHANYAFAPTGTWYRDDATLSIQYRSVAHADPVLTGWLELMASVPVSHRNKFTDAVFNELANPAAPGLCASCHSVERFADGQMQINWRASNRANEPRAFTKFSHGPHLSLPQLVDCTACHAVDANAHDKAAYVGADPCRFVSDFLPMTKRLCASCHTSAAAGDRCQSCHNYHVGASAE